MLQSIKKWLKNFFTLNKNEQRGILVLLILIILVSGVNFVVLPLLPTRKQVTDPTFQKDVARFLSEQKRQKDSVALLRLRNKGELTQAQALKLLTPFPFDPNRMDSITGTKLGLTTKQIGTIENYLRKGGHFRKKEDFKKMYCISDAEYQVLSPFIRIRKDKKVNRVSYAAVHINTCTANDLAQNLHLYPSLARRVIKYRNLLGNFYTKDQLKEVYGFSAKTYNKVRMYVLCDSMKVKKIDLNNAPFKTLLHHPYLDYKTTLQIVKARDRLLNFRNVLQLKTQASIPDSLYNKIHHYLYIRPH
jgi:DNA uptake protein ComE-like DNA-binding protein